MRKFTNPLLKLSAVASTFLLTTGAHAAAGDADSFLNVANTAGSNIYAATNIISTGSYVLGAGFAVSAARGFQQHAEAGGAQHPIHKPLVKAVVASMLIATPWAIQTMFQSAGINESTTVGVDGGINRLGTQQ